jgi:hypothetical protein
MHSLTRRSQIMRAAIAASGEHDLREQVRELMHERSGYINRIRELQAENAHLRMKLVRYEREAVQA